MQRLCVVAVLDELVGNLLCLYLRTTEDDSEDAGVEVYDALQGEVFILGMHEVVDVVDVLGTFVARTDDNLSMVVQIGLGNAFNLATHRCREHQRIALLGQVFENLVDALRESHVQHLVGFIEHHAANLTEVGFTTVHQVNQSARCSHNNLHATTQLAYLQHDAGSAIDCYDIHCRHILCEIANVVANLQTQFTRGTEYQGLRLTVFGVEALQQGNAKGGRLSRSRLGQSNEVALPVGNV